MQHLSNVFLFLLTFSATSYSVKSVAITTNPALPLVNTTPVPLATTMSLSAEAFFNYMEKIEAQRSDEIRNLTISITEGVKKEIDAALKPLDEKQKLLDDNQKILFSEQSLMKDQLSAILKQLSDLQKPPSSPNALHTPLSSGPNLVASSEKENEDEIPARIVAQAMRIVGFSRITRDDLEWIKTEHSIDNDNDALIYAINEFLDCEMKVPLHIIRQLKIVKVFPPAHRLDFTRLYAEFSDIQSANLVFSYARNLKPGTSVFLYVPHQFYKRFQDVDNEAYKLRNSDEKWKTKIKFGSTDLILLKKPRNGGIWTEVNIDNLSPLDLHSTLQPPTVSSSPPRGRKRPRADESTDNDELSSKSMKTADPTPEDPLKKPVDVGTSIPLPTPQPSPDLAQPQADHDQLKTPPPNNQTQQVLDRGSFQPSAYLSPRAQAINKDFTFGTKIPTFSNSSLKSLN
jgi:hypothetical protein